MASELQIAANRANAQKSTGPGTPEAKAKVRLNAMRDGITGQVTTLSDEDRPIFEALKAELIKDLAPKTVMELKLANSIAWDTWRLDHLRATEMNIYALGAESDDTAVDCDDPQIHIAMTAARTFCKEAKRFDLMSLYEQRMNRSLHKNLATLRALRAERKLDHDRERDNEVVIARSNQINGLPYQAAAASATNGIVFSNSEILAAAARKRTLEVANSTVYVTPLAVETAAASDERGPRRPKSGLKVAAAA